MISIHKYLIDGLRTTVNLPIGSRVLTVKLQYNQVFLWALEDSTKPEIERVFLVYGDNEEIPKDQNLLYLETLLQHGGSTVWHVFESTPT